MEIDCRGSKREALDIVDNLISFSIKHGLAKVLLTPDSLLCFLVLQIVYLVVLQFESQRLNR